MECSTLDGKPWNCGLLEFRNSPITSGNSNRVPCSVLPQLPAAVTANMPQIQQYHDELVNHQGISTDEQETLKLEPGQPVWVQDPISLSWKPATIKEHADEPSSY